MSLGTSRPVVVIAATAALVFAADLALAQPGGGGRGPTLFGRNPNSAAVRWYARSFGPNTRIRRFAEGRNVATGGLRADRPYRPLGTPTGVGVIGGSSYVSRRPTVTRQPVGSSVTTGYRGVTPAPNPPRTTASTRSVNPVDYGLPPGAKIISINGVPVE